MRKLLYFILFSIVLIFCSCQVTRFVVYNFANIDDHEIFPFREISNEAPAFEFIPTDGSKAPKTANTPTDTIPFDQFLAEKETVAFLIIKNDSIYYETYLNKYDTASIVNSFSMAKSVLSILIGIAIDEQLIKSVDEPITKYIPELKEKGFEKVKILHLLQMTSGLKFNESYVNPFGDAATFYYGRNLRKSINKLKLEAEPGTRFNYVSGDSQLLGLVLERALKDRSISEYLEEKLWKPMGMEYPASWSLDRKKDGLEKTFCCLNARARDFAKIGRLYLNKGDWNGEQLVPKSWVERSTAIDSTAGSAWYYQYQWWLGGKDGDFVAEGILGQCIYVNPSKNLVMVRLGKKTAGLNWEGLMASIAANY